MAEKRTSGCRAVRVGAILVACAVGCAHAAAESAPSSQPAVDPARALAAADKAKGFLDGLAPKMDPVKLRAEHGMKGKKFLVEYLNAWWDLYQISDEAGRQAIRQKLRPIAARLNNEAYHDLRISSDRKFKQDIISYLSACVLLEKLGFKTGRYRREIGRIAKRTLSQKHLRQRGIDNTMAIVYRLRQLGFDGGPTFCDLWKRPGCVTREHPDLTKLNLDTFHGRLRVYDMTHEIFYLTEFGKTKMQCVSEKDLDYIRRMHRALIPIFIEKKNVDALAELLMDLNHLNMADWPEYAAGYSYILDRQNADGSWGDAQLIAQHVKPILMQNKQYLVDVGQYLHTTEVCLNALCWPLRREDSGK